LTSASLNRGTAFTLEERHHLGLTGRLPSAVPTLEDEAQRLWQQLSSLPTDLARNLLLEQVHNRNEVLYFNVLSEHLPELLPVVYDPTVGAAIECYSHEYCGQRGVYLSIDRPDEIAESFPTMRSVRPTISSSFLVVPRRSSSFLVVPRRSSSFLVVPRRSSSFLAGPSGAVGVELGHRVCRASSLLDSVR
jgi:hypothetical protein